MKPSTRPSTSTPPRPSTRPAASPRTRALFVAFARIHGDRWLAMWDAQNIEDVELDWAAKLARFDDATLRLALDAWLAEGSAFPPNLAQFVALCLQFRPQPTVRPALVAPRPPPPEGVFERLKRELMAKRSSTGSDADDPAGNA